MASQDPDNDSEEAEANDSVSAEGLSAFFRRLLNHPNGSLLDLDSDVDRLDCVSQGSSEVLRDRALGAGAGGPEEYDACRLKMPSSTVLLEGGW